MNAKRFFEILQKSDLLDPDQVRQAMLDCKEANGGEPLSDAELVGDFLIDRGLITKWHRDKILAGKYKGFFLGKYKLLGHIGTGGMSTVYLAEHLLMRQQRAIKVLPRKRIDDKEYLDRFYLEARASAALRHPNIVQAYDVDCESDTHFIVMEFVDGLDLNVIVKRTGPLPFELVANYTAQAALGLQHAHEQGLIHRDIKPGNLLVDQNNVLKILDMGLALFSRDEESAAMESDDQVLGTADFLSPEQSHNSHEVDTRSDIYSLGCSMYFMLTGHAPFPEGSIAQRIAAHQKRMPDPIRASRPECPGNLIEICTKMIQKRADDRFQTSIEISEELDRWLVRNGFAKISAGRTTHPNPCMSRTGSGSVDDDPASSSARLLEGVSESKKKEADIDADADADGPSASTDPVQDALAETLTGLSNYREDDEPAGLPKIDPNRQSAPPESASPSADAGTQPARTQSAVAESGRPDIDLDGLAELEGLSTTGRGSATTSPLAHSHAPAQQARRTSRTIPVWLWAVLGVAGGLILVLTLILIIANSGSDNDDRETQPSNDSFRESTAMRSEYPATTRRS